MPQTNAAALPKNDRRRQRQGQRDHAPFPPHLGRNRSAQCRPKPHRADEVQLCAQAICLEEMCGLPVPEGALFYGAQRRRTRVAFDDALRALTARVAADAKAMLAANRTPPPVSMPACKSCSLRDICQPDRLQKPPAVDRWLATRFEADTP